LKKFFGWNIKKKNLIKLKTVEELITYFNHYIPLSKDAFQAIAEICKPVFIKKNKDLQSIGHTCRTIYFIKKGVARIYYFKEDIEITECFAFENSIIARVESLFTEKPSRKAIQMILPNFLHFTTLFLP
jgi:hypothetical protein